MTKRSRVCFGIAAVLLLGASVDVARGDDHRPPKSMLFAGQSRQPGRYLHYTWIRRYDAESCVITFAHGIFDFPKAIRYQIGEQARIRLMKAANPSYIELEAYKRVDRKGAPKGDPIQIPFHLEPRIVDGAVVAWEIVFSLPPGQKHFYLLATADWPDQDGCHPPPDIGSQYVIWQFHLRAS